jgi:hypothetical protein
MTEPLSVIAADNPVTCAVYAREHDLLDIEGWRRFWNLAKREKHFLRLVKQAKMKSYCQSPKYNFGYRIPKDYEEALKLDELNQNTKWENATVTEMSQLKEYVMWMLSFCLQFFLFTLSHMDAKSIKVNIKLSHDIVD